MTYSVIVLPRAVDQITAAVSWWRSHRPEAPALLEDELSRAFARIAEMPGAGTPVRGPGDCAQ